MNKETYLPRDEEFRLHKALDELDDQIEEGLQKDLDLRTERLKIIGKLELEPILTAIGQFHNPNFSKDSLIYEPIITDEIQETIDDDLVEDRRPELFLVLNYHGLPPGQALGTVLLGLKAKDSGNGRISIAVVNPVLPGYKGIKTIDLNENYKNKNELIYDMKQYVKQIRGIKIKGVNV